MGASLVRALLAGGVSLFAVGCTTVGPAYQPPTLDLPDSWSQARIGGIEDGEAARDAWWRHFEDQQMGDLVERALRSNLDLKAALARLQSARALRGVAAAGRFPTLEANADYQHSEASTNTPFGAFIPATDIHTVNFDAAWELDLWGRVRRSVEAADRDVEASTADLQAAALTVAAEVARTYVEVRATERRLAIAEQNLALQQRTLELVLARSDAGLVVERDVAQARTNVEQTRARLPQLEAEAIVAANRLAVLVGEAPGRLDLDTARSGVLPGLPVHVAVGAPVDLLLRRPDVRRAERQFAAEVARVGVAEADRYPRLLISGQFGIQSDGAADLVDGDSLFFNVGPSIRWTLFDGGRLKSRVLSFEAQAEAAAVVYEQSILLAIEETENALTSFVREQARRASLARAAEEARRAVTLAETQYREGLTDFQTVLDSQRIVATIEDDLARSDAAVATNLIALFKALGGDFRPEPPAQAVQES